MKFLYYSTCLAVLLAALPLGTADAADDYFQQDVHYTIHARLDTEARMLTGTETILYKNNSPDTLWALYLHLYPNGYKSKESALLKHYTRRYNTVLFDLPEKYRSYLNIENVKVDGLEAKTHIDDTIAELVLPMSLLPGDSMVIEMNFQEKIREQIGRGGYRGNQYDLAQWYPKVVVYDENGHHPDKFEAGEFYGEFGTFDVSIDVPEDFVVAATGVVVEGDPGWTLNPPGVKTDTRRDKGETKSFKTIHFRAEKVHDFAWSASPDFAVEDSTWNGVEVRSFYNKNNRAWKDTTLTHGIRALEWLTDKVGPYPYPQLSIVEGLASSGMEYPMLTLNGYVSESLVLHEVGHIYFYGILANDERAEPWLDEGLTTFQTQWYLRERYGPWGNQRQWNLYERLTPQYTIAQKGRSQVFSLQRREYSERIAKRAEEFMNSYGVHTYVKAALVMDALRYVVGEEAFENILHEYYNRWKFKHVNEKRFREVCEDVSGMDLKWFFDEWLHTIKNCDYTLDKITTTQKEEGYQVDVVIKREGEIIMPLALVLYYKDGRKETFRVAGRLRTIKKTVMVKQPPVRAAINPDNKIMDMNLSDNFRRRATKFQFDWPKNSFYPEDGYQIRHRPGFWYNDVDGFKLGFVLKGSYANWNRRVRLGIYYGFDSERVDFSLRYHKPFRLFGTRSMLSITGYKMEGRVDGTLTLNLRRRKYLPIPPNQDIQIQINYHELNNTRFIENLETYQKKGDFGIIFAYNVDPQFDIFKVKAGMAIRFGRDWFSAKYNYEKFYGSFSLKTRTSLFPIPARLRFFFGIGGGQMPYQQKFYLADGGPLARNDHFYTRSIGAVPEELNYHKPGHGNLRGYLAGSFGVNRLIATNVEVDFPVPLPIIRRVTDKILGRINGTLFFDVGRIFDDENPISDSERIQQIADEGLLSKALLDAGLGLRSWKRFPFYDMYLRLDFPFYVGQPRINGEDKEWDYRYVFSLQGSF